MNSTLDLAILDKHIIGRVTPHIYAFSTGTVPSYLKVGDTYRPVATRLAEWRHAFPDLESHFQAPATLGEQQDTYFRDYSVHRYLEAHDHIRLQPEDLDHGVYYSREFFRDATPGDVEQAIEDIRASYEADDARYSLSRGVDVAAKPTAGRRQLPRSCAQRAHKPADVRSHAFRQVLHLSRLRESDGG